MCEYHLKTGIAYSSIDLDDILSFSNKSCGCSSTRECEVEFLQWFLAKYFVFSIVWGEQTALKCWVNNIEKQALPIQVLL